MEKQKKDQKKLKKVDMIPVQSSNVDFIGHIKETKRTNGQLFIQFKNGGVYQYEKVDHITFDQLKKSGSIGKFIYNAIRPFYQANKIQDIEKSGYKFNYLKINKGDENENKDQ